MVVEEAMVRIGLVGVVLAGSLAAAQNYIPNPTYGTPITGSGFHVQPGSLNEASCENKVDGGTTACTATFNVTIEKGYSNSAAVIFLRNFYLRFANPTGGPVKQAKLMLERNTYNSLTGDFSWSVNVLLDASPALPIASDSFQFGFDFVILVGDNSTFRASRRSASNFTLVGSMGNDSCDSTTECEDLSTYSSVGTTTAPFRAMVLRGFDVSNAAGNGFDLTQLRFDVSTITPSGSTSTSGEAYCTATSPTTDGISCELGMVSLAFPTTHLTSQFIDSYVSNKTGTYSNAYGQNSSSSTAASNFILGLQATDHGLRSASDWLEVSSGCGDTFFNSSPGTGSVSGYGRHGFVSPTTPSVSYNSYVRCFLGFLY